MSTASCGGTPVARRTRDLGEPGFMIPRRALVVFAGVEKILVVKDGKAHEQRVRTGLRVGDRVELIDGVSAGDMIIAAPGGLADGSPVTVSQ